MLDRITLKRFFERGKKPTQEQFAAWIDSFWHKNDELPIASIDQLALALSQKLDIDTLPERMAANTTVFLPIHAPLNSANITEPLAITGIAINRNCERILFIDKADINNTLEIECRKQPEGEMAETDISLVQFVNKTIYVLAVPVAGKTDVDISLTLKKI